MRTASTTMDDKPTIGLLLCKQQNRLVAESALSAIDKHIGVAGCQLLRDLPEHLERSLPSIAEIEAQLSVDVSPPDAPAVPSRKPPRRAGSAEMAWQTAQCSPLTAFIPSRQPP